ncbi:MAG: hypothetical protein ALAOOOJD_00152 [bacterium]|nr:hypothetical protein [bacterium]
MMISNPTRIESTMQQRFTEFMQEQVTRIERFRRYLCRRQHCEISFDNAVTVWIERGYAAAFRRRFEEQV